MERMDMMVKSPLLVRELIEILQMLPYNTVIVVPSVEGNGQQADTVRRITEMHATEIGRDPEKEKNGLPQQPGADYALHKTPRDNSVKVVFIH